jgi:hypothetical protein
VVKYVERDKKKLDASRRFEIGYETVRNWMRVDGVLLHPLIYLKNKQRLARFSKPSCFFVFVLISCFVNEKSEE